MRVKRSMRRPLTSQISQSDSGAQRFSSPVSFKPETVRQFSHIFLDRHAWPRISKDLCLLRYTSRCQHEYEVDIQISSVDFSQRLPGPAAGATVSRRVTVRYHRLALFSDSALVTYIPFSWRVTSMAIRLNPMRTSCKKHGYNLIFLIYLLHDGSTNVRNPLCFLELLSDF